MLWFLVAPLALLLLLWRETVFRAKPPFRRRPTNSFPLPTHAWWTTTPALAGIAAWCAPIALAMIGGTTTQFRWSGNLAFSFVIGEIIAMACVEEAIFRGTLLGWLSRYLSLPSAVIFQAAVFSLLHMPNLAQMLITFALGIFLGWLVIGSGTLMSAAIAHGASNLVFLSASYQGLMVDSLVEVSFDSHISDIAPLIRVVLYCIFIAVLALCMRRTVVARLLPAEGRMEAA